MSKFNTWLRGRTSALSALLAGVLLSSVGIAFNISHGWSLGGSDALRCFGMAALFLGCIALKDSLLGQLALAIKAGKYGLALACVLGFAIGAVGSGMAALGSASEGREEKSDPKAAQITAFKMAEKTMLETETTLNGMGAVVSLADAQLRVTQMLGRVEPGIAKRTKDCTLLSNPTTGPKQVAANKEACQPVIEAQARVAKAEEVSGLRAKLEAARAIVSKGAPKSADSLADTVTSFAKKFTGADGAIDGAAVLAAIVMAIVEIGGPVSWMIWQLSGDKPESKPDRPAIPKNVPKSGPDQIPDPSMKRGRKPSAEVMSFADEFRKRNGRSPRGFEIRRKFPGLPKSTAYDYADRSRKSG